MEAIIENIQNPAVISGGVAVVAGLFMMRNNKTPLETEVPGISDLGRGALEKAEVQNQADDMMNFFEQSGGKGTTADQTQTPAMVQKFYNLVTDIYEYGWGQSFHFAPRDKGQGLMESIIRHEERLSDCIGLGPGMTALDVGCGVGGPMRNIAKYSGGNVTGITICEYQVKRGNMHNKKAGLEDQCKIVQGNFLELPFEDETFDCAYAIEATCHAPVLVDVYKQAYNAVKPGGLFATYEWVTTEMYDENNKEHNDIIDGINRANGLPNMRTYKQALAAMEEAGFEIVAHRDIRRSAVPWWQKLKSGAWVHTFRDYAISSLESIGIAPKGTAQVHKMLTLTARALVRGGETECFTPCYLIIARKPNN